jgi:hypothetical protein
VQGAGERRLVREGVRDVGRISSISGPARRPQSTKCVVGTHFVDRDPLNVLEIAEMRPEARILELAGRHHGVVTSAQIVAAG